MRYMVNVKPSAGAGEVRVDGDEIHVSLKSPPEKGRANAELVKRLAKEFGVSPDRVRIVSGLSSRKKIVEIT